jgi:hypothetical protein
MCCCARCRKPSPPSAGELQRCAGSIDCPLVPADCPAGAGILLASHSVAVAAAA